MALSTKRLTERSEYQAVCDLEAGNEPINAADPNFAIRRVLEDGSRPGRSLAVKAKPEPSASDYGRATDRNRQRPEFDKKLLLPQLGFDAIAGEASRHDVLGVELAGIFNTRDAVVGFKSQRSP